MFISSSLTLWNLELAGLTGIESVEEPAEAQTLFDSLHRAIVDYTGDDSIQELSVESMEHGLLRSNLYRWAELLLEVPFSPDKE